MTQALRLPVTLIALPLLLAVSASVAQAPTYRGFRCPAIEPMPRAMAVTGRYKSGRDDQTYSVLDPAKVEQQKSERGRFDRPVTRINALSTTYLSSQDEGQRSSIADCLARHFAALPAASAMEGADTPTDVLYRDWMASSLAVSYLRAKAALDTAPDAAAVHGWFARIAAQSRAAYAERGKQRGLDNHSYWAAATVAAIGRVNDDAEALAYGRSILIEALRQVDADGILAAEIRRGGRARHYHLFSIVPLAAIAILTGTDPEALGGDGFDRLARRIVSDFEDPAGGLIAKRSGQAQETESPGQLSLVVPLIRKDDLLAERLRKLTAGARSTSYFLGGDLGFLIGLAAKPVGGAIGAP